MTVPLISARPPCASAGAAAPRMEHVSSHPTTKKLGRAGSKNRRRVRIEASLKRAKLAKETRRRSEVPEGRGGTLEPRATAVKAGVRGIPIPRGPCPSAVSGGLAARRAPHPLREPAPGGLPGHNLRPHR